MADIKKMRGRLGTEFPKRFYDLFCVRKYNRVPRKLKKMLKKQMLYNKNAICYERRFK